jgi:sec-independent protein translocase protein TatA
MLDGLFEPTHIIFILLIVLIIFGPGKLPQLGKGLGEGIRGFKEAIKGGSSHASSANPDTTKTPEQKNS